MQSNMQESIVKAPMLYQPLPLSAANRSFIILTFGGIVEIF